jgi:hypothetical protein
MGAVLADGGPHPPLEGEEVADWDSGADKGRPRPICTLPSFNWWANVL